MTINANGHRPKRAITYVRVSGERQREHGYSLDDQWREPRQWSDENGYRIVEEIEDGAWSGGRPAKTGP